MSSLCSFALIPFSACMRADGNKKNNAQVTVCNGVSCTANGGGMRTFAALQALAPYDTDVTLTGCLGACKEGSNVVINGKIIVNPNQVLGKLGIRPDIRALRAIKLKAYADKLKSTSISSSSLERCIRAYKIGLKCLTDNPKGEGVSARIAANLANACIDAEMFGEALETAKWSIALEETQGALYAASVASVALNNKNETSMADNNYNVYVAKLNKEKKAALDKWMKDRERKLAWSKLGSIFFQKT